MDMPTSAPRKLAEPSPRGQIGDLLGRYPDVSAGEAEEILRFLKKRPPLVVIGRAPPISDLTRGEKRAVPKAAQDRIVRGPFGALLILLSLLMGSGTAAAAGFDVRQPVRLGASRQSAAVGLLPSSIRTSSDEDELASGSGGSVPPSAPHLVTESLPVRPAAEPSFPADKVQAERPAASYRARAPPAA